MSLGSSTCALKEAGPRRSAPPAHVLRLADAAEHPVGDGERRRAKLVDSSSVIAQPSPCAKPCRQLGYRSCQPSSRLALAFEAPRTSVIMSVPASPAASQRGTRRLGLAHHPSHGIGIESVGRDRPGPQRPQPILLRCAPGHPDHLVASCHEPGSVSGPPDLCPRLVPTRSGTNPPQSVRYRSQRPPARWESAPVAKRCRLIPMPGAALVLFMDFAVASGWLETVPRG